jgi:hypothetical protein
MIATFWLKTKNPEKALPPRTPPPTHQMELGVSPSQSERAGGGPRQTNRGWVVGGLLHPVPGQQSRVVDPLKSPFGPKSSIKIIHLEWCEVGEGGREGGDFSCPPSPH